MSDEQFILFERSGYFKGKSVVLPSRVLMRQNSSLIADIFSRSLPSLVFSYIPSIFSHRVHSRRHSIVEERVRFGEIDNRKGVLLACSHVFHGEVKPLIVASGISIIGHHQIVLVFS